MRKVLVFPIVFAAFCAGFDAFSATARGSRSIANAGATTETAKSVGNAVSSGNQPIAARAASRTRIQPVSTASGANSARVATRTTVKSVAPQSTAQSTTQPVPQQQVGSGVVARAGSKQKAVNMGTTVKSATENTNIPQECQDAFYGCMDSFCMMDNTSGGRCRCDDRAEELDAALDKLMEVDTLSKTVADEGVSRLQLGDAVDAVYSTAEEAKSKVIADQKKNQIDLFDANTSKNKSNQLDLSIFNTAVFDTDDLFGDIESDNVLESDLANKKGSALRRAATKLCLSTFPAQCKENSSILQNIYAVKIRTDCISYENYLKQQKMNSEDLKRTADRAVRDAALEQYEKKNKYKTVGECVIAFKQCMIGEDVCGSGFSKCVIDPTLLTDKSKSSKSYTIKTSKSITVEISASTYGALEGNRGFCDSVLAQCVDVNKNDAVWKQFLVNVAPELKGAEYAAEDESRRNCARNVVSCIKEVAAGEEFTEGSDKWYIFTSNPNNVENLCGGELRKCSAYDETGAKGTMYTAVMDFVELSLNALRADRCTTKVKQCLESDMVCGKDYSQCIGVNGDYFWNNCEDIVTPDCDGKIFDNKGDTLKDYVNKVASGVLLNADNQISKRCRQAVDKIMNETCGGTTSCDGAGMEIDDATIESLFEYNVCKPSGSGCSDKVSSVEALNEEDMAKYKAVLNPKVEISDIKVSFNTDTGTKVETDAPFKVDNPALKSKLNQAYKVVYNKIATDPTVESCLKGSSAQGFDGDNLVKTESARKFPNLTQSSKYVIANGILNAFARKYNTVYESYKDKQMEDSAILSAAKTKEDKFEKCKQMVKDRYGLNDNFVQSKNAKAFTIYKNVTVFEEDGKCCVDRIVQTCKTYSDDNNNCTEYNPEQAGRPCFYKMW